MSRLAGCAAIVTGASSGIGAATARALAREGAAIALVARRRDRLAALAAEIGALGGCALVVEADLAVAPAAGEAIARAHAALGRLDVLVNNAGTMYIGPVRGAPLAEWRRMLDLNLRALMRASRAGLPYLLQAAASEPRHVADLVNVSSVAGRIARGGAAVYAATKFGVAGFSESLRAEVMRRFVRVCVIEPGLTATEIVDHSRQGPREAFLARLGALRPLQPEDVADAVVHAVTRPRHVAINELLLRSTEQEA